MPNAKAAWANAKKKAMRSACFMDGVEEILIVIISFPALFGAIKNPVLCVFNHIKPDFNAL